MAARVQLMFFLTGVVSATWAARIPAIQEGLALSPGALGLAILGLEAGAVAGLPAGGALVTRRGSRAILRLGFATYPSALVAVALAPGLGALAAALAAMAFANSLVDVAMNVQGVALERHTGRPLMARLHAGHAFGVLAGGLGGTLAAAAELDVAPHFLAVAALALVVGELAARALLDARREDAPSSAATAGGVRRIDGDPRPTGSDPRPTGSDPRPTGSDPRPTGGDSAAAAGRRRAETGAATATARGAAPIGGGAVDGHATGRDNRVRGWIVQRMDRRLALLGAVAFCAFLLDGAAYAWIAVQLRAEGADPALAAAGFTAFALALALGRLIADRPIARHGRAAVVGVGGALAAAGLGAALIAPSPALALAGWAAFGAGIAPIAPAVLAAAPGASPLPAPAAIAAVTTVGYLGSFTGPPLIGALAGPLGLTTALGLMAVAALAAALLARPALRACT